MHIHQSQRIVVANTPPFTCLLVTTNTGACHWENRQTDLRKGSEWWCDARGSFQSQITRTITNYFLPFRANGSLITPITFTHSLRSRKLWPLRFCQFAPCIRTRWIRGQSPKIRFGQFSACGLKKFSALCLLLFLRKDNMFPNTGLVDQFSATPRGQLNWTRSFLPCSMVS